MSIGFDINIHTSRTVDAIWLAIGFPPNVFMCSPTAVLLAIFGVVTTAAIGNPFAIP